MRRAGIGGGGGGDRKLGGNNSMLCFFPKRNLKKCMGYFTLLSQITQCSMIVYIVHYQIIKALILSYYIDWL